MRSEQSEVQSKSFKLLIIMLLTEGSISQGKHRSDNVSAKLKRCVRARKRTRSAMEATSSDNAHTAEFVPQLEQTTGETHMKTSRPSQPTSAPIEDFESLSFMQL